MASCGGRCGTPCQMICTIMFGICWVVMLLATLLLHSAVVKLVPELQNLPDNLHTGFYDSFGFNSLNDESLNIKNSCEKALRECDIVDPTNQCGQDHGTDHTDTYDANPQVAEINAAFSRSLDKIYDVVRDKYLGNEKFNSTASDLNNITAQLDRIKLDPNTPCFVNIPMFCGMRETAKSMSDGVSQVTGEIDKLVASKEVEDFKKYAEFLVALHGLPYLLWISMFFFSCFWFSARPTCCCCKGRPLPACAYFCHLFFWLFFFVVVCVFCGVGYGLQEVAKTEKMDVSGINGKPTLKEFIDHIETAFPKFYDVVLKDLLAAMKVFLDAFTGLAGVVLFIFFYGCSICCTAGRPYYVAPKVQDGVEGK